MAPSRDRKSRQPTAICLICTSFDTSCSVVRGQRRPVRAVGKVLGERRFPDGGRQEGTQECVVDQVEFRVRELVAGRLTCHGAIDHCSIASTAVVDPGEFSAQEGLLVLQNEAGLIVGAFKLTELFGASKGSRGPVQACIS